MVHAIVHAGNTPETVWCGLPRSTTPATTSLWNQTTCFECLEAGVKDGWNTPAARLKELKKPIPEEELDATIASIMRREP